MTAIEETWQMIRTQNPDTPEVIVTLGAGSDLRGSGLRLGHFAPSRWVRADVEVHELFVGGEGLERGPVAVLGTLLHEAAHGIAATRGIQDTSRQGRYHNKKFQAIAHEVGIEVEHSRELGYSTTTVPEATERRYSTAVTALGAAITAYRRAEVAGAAGGRGSSNNGLSLACGCGRKIRASVSVAEAGPIICGLCEAPFEAPETDTDPE
ncbi:hypothetical protein BRM3_14950 (plasmid) [Brachybacterium huguangmaarense]|uniref:SprT-like family protein n=1 Tax=Brachybacterium huguangmaarense TaxID=1652028 RepID=A0ABY6G531_9MICO|nr:hypothetical protein [Brachybacterium huguangmaarense]UYG18322.1 hypothetical protein BRM3_14950 [Brachybacterium huguangmaarense]